LGEYADMAIDDMMNVDYCQINGDYDDYDDPVWNPFSGRWRGFRKRPITCNQCKSPNLHWEQVSGEWKLFEAAGDLHVHRFSFKSMIGKKLVDTSDPIGYNAYLDSEVTYAY
jgi:hypothetical protein